jgi:hypothetical protein
MSKGTALTPDPTGVSNYYSALEAAANAAVGSTIHADITPIQAGAQGDFAYNYLNASLLFNQWTFNYLSTMAQAGDYPNTAKLTPAGSFPQSFLQLVNQIIFQFSEADQQALTNAQNNSQTQQLNVVQTYVGLYGQITPTMIADAVRAGWLSRVPGQQTPFNYILNYVVGGDWAGKSEPPGLSLTRMRTAPSLSALLPNTPADGPPVIAAVTAYLNAIGPVTALMDQQSFGNFLINQIKQALLTPTVGVAGMTVTDPTGQSPDTVVPKYGIAKSMQQIQNDLKSSSQISMSMQAQQQSSSVTNVSINGGASFSFGGPIVTYLSASTSYNMESIKGAGTAWNISVIYQGYSLIPLAPQALVVGAGGATTGWYLPTMIAEANQNWETGGAATGFNFQNAPSINLAQFPSGDFNLLSNLLISTYPTIAIEYTAGDYNSFKTVFAAQASGSVKLFGFIPIGSASMSTYTSTLVQGSSNTHFSVNFTPPSTAGVSLLQQTAYVIGGVVVSPAQRQTSIVEVLLAAADV